MEMLIHFPGGKRVSSSYKGFTVETDQPRSEGGEGVAPEPYDLFLSSMGTCAGVYIVYFCESRNIPTDGLSMTLRFERNASSHLVEKIAMEVHLPPGFPDKYRKAVVRAAQMCTVKRTLVHPPEIEVTTTGKD
ncbi:osmotically inducible protein C [Desulfosarcina alkanivorans]|jgi:ribosomal protein S12 methylthiotransferase accessory factor|uniref:Osmotically inducible protein C n=1 Tax=Desulfosarcina alkanivorans TaxID=571177 RepID=A0A5K7YV29_9BACT|nr:OsmC family protein [Desulfosarcina alkanivorans]BBO70164.1 osmotically inducible protein C [Desulfosarcina alkanivorans]